MKLPASAGALRMVSQCRQASTAMQKATPAAPAGHATCNYLTPVSSVFRFVTGGDPGQVDT